MMIVTRIFLWTTLLGSLHVSGSLAFGSFSAITGNGAFLENTRNSKYRQASQSFKDRQTCSRLRSSILGDDDREGLRENESICGLPSAHFIEQESAKETKEKTQGLKSFIDGLRFVDLFRAPQRLPPIQVDDTSLLMYDVFLIINLTLSISFWVTHRLEFAFLPYAFSEGCLLSIFWIVSGLYNGIFLHGAVDGHYGPTDERGGPKAAATLALNTFINAVNLRLAFALLVAVAEHRLVGINPAEQILPLEIGFGLLLMSSWRALHSFITPRI